MRCKKILFVLLLVCLLAAGYVHFASKTTNASTAPARAAAVEAEQADLEASIESTPSPQGGQEQPAPEPTVAQPVQPQAVEAVAVASSEPASPPDAVDMADEEVEDAPPPTSEPSPNLVGTYQMYAAHVSLRDPAIADPDSVENQRILQSMITKALERKAADASAPSSR